MYYPDKSLIKVSIDNSNYKIVPIFIHYNNSISSIVKGEIIAVIQELTDFNQLNALVNTNCTLHVITGDRYFIITGVDIYYGSPFNNYDQTNNYTVILHISDQLCRLNNNKQYKCFHNLSPISIVRNILSKYNIRGDYNNLSSSWLYRNLPMKMQYNESDFEFLQRIVGEYKMFFCYKENNLIFYDNTAILPIINVNSNHLEPINTVFQGNKIGSFNISTNSVKLKNPNYDPYMTPEIPHFNPYQLFLKTDGEIEVLSADQASYRADIFMENKNVYEYIIESPNMNCGCKFLSHLDGRTYISTSTSQIFLLYTDMSISPSAQAFIKQNTSLKCNENIFNKLWKQTSYFSLNQCVLSNTVSFLGKYISKPKGEIQNAMVINPTMQKQLSNEYGDVLIQFMWDNNMEGHIDVNNTCWAKVCQLMASYKYGINVIPRTGDEVIVDFLHGDIDRPIILGSVTNSMNSPYYAGNTNKISIKTCSIGSEHKGDRFNELTFDDSQNKEIVYLRSQNNMCIDIMDGSLSLNINNSTVASHNSVTIKNGDFTVNLQNGNCNLDINGNHSLQVKGDINWDIDGDININCNSFNVSGKSDNKISSATKTLLESPNITIHSSDLNVASSAISLTGSMVQVTSEVELMLRSNSMSMIIDTNLMINSTAIVNITTGLFSLTSTSSVSIVSTIPGILHGFLPYYP